VLDTLGGSDAVEQQFDVPLKKSRSISAAFQSSQTQRKHDGTEQQRQTVIQGRATAC
jgi:hypothetical protein